MNDQVHDAPSLRQRIEKQTELVGKWEDARSCLLYTSDAADEL